ncbi:MAG: MMPL family transporter [Acidobacteria bacterium]|nr:MMPL family transporter [Acidobacteriota bacterium]
MAVTERLARVCSRHRRATIIAWIAVMALAAAALVLALGSLTTNGHPTNDPESQRAAAAIDRAFPPDPHHAVSDFIDVRSSRDTVASPAFRGFVSRLVAGVRATGVVSNVELAYRTGAGGTVSADRHALLVPILIRTSDDAGAVEDVVARSNADPAFAVAITGDATNDYDVNTLSQHDLKSGELRFGIPAALVVLLLVFGTVVAGLVPLLMAIISIVVALGLVAVLSQAFDLSVFIINMLTGMGLALGIDYSLFVVSRYREERAAGAEPVDAIGGTGATASRSVLVSGTAFVVAMCGMMIVPNNVMRSLALGAILVGIVSVVAALTLLPALLGLLGDRVNAWRIPLVGRASLETSNPEGRFWRAIVSAVLRRPTISLVAAVDGVSTLPHRFAARNGFVALQRDFPHATANPVRVVVARDAGSSGAQSGVRRLQHELARDRRFEGGGTIVRAPRGGVSQLVVPVRGDPDGRAAVTAVRDLRRRLVPSAFGATAGNVLVGGETAETADYLTSVSSPAPYVFLFVLGMTFVLLTIVFRSVVVAATALLLNLLSVGAAYGLLVLVFQHGVGAGLLGFHHADTIEAWVPLFLFSVLFGLSMDYQVFLLSRIRERYDATGVTADAVTHGVAATARIITGAALIIVAVFLGFAMGDLIMFQQMGFGVAVALLLDATLIRSVVLPSAMKLLGERNWYFPRWLDWLPRLEGEERPPAAPRLTQP